MHALSPVLFLALLFSPNLLLSVSRPDTPEQMCSLPGEAVQAAVRREYGKQWRLVETEHFKVYSDSGLRIHFLTAGLMEQFYAQVHPAFFSKPMRRLRVCLVERSQDYESFLGLRGLGQIGRTMGLYLPSDRSIYARRRLEDGSLSGLGTLFHEAIHAMVHAEMGEKAAPVWFNEGFASLFEQGRVLEERWVYGNPSPWRDRVFFQEFKAGRVPGLKRLITMPVSRFYDDDSSRFTNTSYNSGRSLFLYLLTRQGQGVLENAVRQILGGANEVRALENASGMKIDELEAGWRENIGRANAGGAFLGEALSNPSAALLEQGAAAHPGYGMLRLELAEAYAREGQPDKALEAAEASLQDPRLFSPQRAWRIIAQACWNSDRKRTRAALERIVALQPWLEDIEEESFRQLASLLEMDGEPGQAADLLSQLAALQAQEKQ